MLLTDCLLRSTRGAFAARGSRRVSELEDHSGDVLAQPLKARTTALAMSTSERTIILETILPGSHYRQNLSGTFEISPNLRTRSGNDRGLIAPHEGVDLFLMRNRGG